jgi:1,4-alpha-glucan branching enzyme
MRVLILTWEYPPRKIGETSDYVRELATSLVKRGVDIHIITFHDTLIGSLKEADGVNVHRVGSPIRSHVNVVTKALALSSQFVRIMGDIYYSVEKKVDLVDVHGWMCIPAAVTFKKGIGIPFILSIHNLEEYRIKEAISPLSLAIKSIERLGVAEARRILVRSSWMKKEISQLYDVPRGKIKVVSPRSSTWIRNIMRIYEKCRR